MLGALDHVGYLVNDLDGAIAQFERLLGAAVSRRFERPQYSLLGAYLGPGEGSIELFTFTEADLLASRLGDSAVLLDHVAYEVADIDATARAMRDQGVRFCGPDLRAELVEPALLGTARHLWTDPQTCCGQMIQLLEREGPA